MPVNKKSKLPTERQLQGQFIKYLQSTHPKSYIWVDQDSPFRVHTAGFDFLFYVKSKDQEHVAFIECKIEDAKLRPSQLFAKRVIESVGGDYIVARFKNRKSLTDFDIHCVSSTKGFYLIKLRPENFLACGFGPLRKKNAK